MIREKPSGESKGVTYIKFRDASSAAMAIEKMNGKKIQEDGAPLKVMIAETKGGQNTSRSTEPEDHPPRSRLFAICPKEITEEELIAYFDEYPNMEYCKLMKDRETSESKGCAFVKYSLASSAAFAMEEMTKFSEEKGLKIKVMIADPKTKRAKTGFTYPPFYEVPRAIPSMAFLPPYAYTDYPGPMYSSQIISPPMPMYPVSIPIPSSPQSRHTSSESSSANQRLYVVCSKSIKQEELAQQFTKFPGMEYCDLKTDRTSGHSKGFAFVKYATLQAAQMAKKCLNGSEFPEGQTLKVLFAEPQQSKPPKSPLRFEPPASPVREVYGNMMPYPTPAYTLYAPVMAPTLVDGDEPPVGPRLFIVMMGGNCLTEEELFNIFAPFGAIEHIRLQNQKNSGYVKYFTIQSAVWAMTCLDGTDHYGVKLKVEVALPPSDSRKRPRTEGRVS
eukprot:TRINITY_DN8572_c0_g1_i1.p1 TRINITY_DN8572_c0_g1~~TRINITY_DN8572_c0_g1_i1.p1  ORF type:complete len:505 (-),score=104.98 TRINITY_DN8572_c0_g1_i1:135-1469(-)